MTPRCPRASQWLCASPALFSLLACLLPNALPAARWQLVIENAETGLRLLDAQPIPEAAGGPRVDPAGAVATIDFRSTWLDAKGTVLDSGAITVPFGVRAPMLPGGPGACEPVILPGQVAVLRVDGPEPDRAPAALRLEAPLLKSGRFATELSPWNRATHLPLVQQPLPLPKAGLVGSQKIRDTGPNSNRVVIGVLGDGYTAADLAAGEFERDAQSLVDSFLNVSPWDSYFSMVNVYRIDIESNEQGADEDRDAGQPTVTRDTFLNATFWTSGIERLLTINSTGRSRAIAAANTSIGVGQWDFLFVLVNSTRYGGAGGSISISSMHPSAPEIILHEFGHTFGRLADEYSDPFPGYPAGDSEPNVDYDFAGPGLKWLPWVESGTPLPTPDTSAWSNRVGAFEGARYLSTGIYRPVRSCRMRVLGVPFCPVCKDALIRRLHEGTQMVESVLPEVTSPVELGATPAEFAALPAPFQELTYEWRLNDVLLDEETGPTLLLEGSNAPPGASSLQLTVHDATSMVRLASLVETTQWSLTNTAPVNASGWMMH